MCVHWDLAKGSAPSTPAGRFGAPRRLRPRGRCGRRRVARAPEHDGSAVRDHEAAGERPRPAVQLVNRVGDDYTAHRHDHDGATAVVDDEPMHCRERRPGARRSKGFEGARSIPSPDAQCGTLRGLADDVQASGASFCCEPSGARTMGQEHIRPTRKGT